jgi:hypothetical protein
VVDKGHGIWWSAFEASFVRFLSSVILHVLVTLTAPSHSPCRRSGGGVGGASAAFTSVAFLGWLS